MDFWTILLVIYVAIGIEYSFPFWKMIMDPGSSVSANEVVKVFILAGQSNMEGKAQNKLLEHQAQAEGTKKEFERYRRDGQWVIRDDVFIKFLGRHGCLTIGYGSNGRTGVELEFGTMMGEKLDEPVLLIKAAWGGVSLMQNFRPPSAGLPSEEYLKNELEKVQKQVKHRNEQRKRNDPVPTMDEIKLPYGVSYRAMMKEVNETMAQYETLFPALEGKKLDLAGFVWFQGWNDQFNGGEKDYASNMKHFINDVRKDLKSPKLPFVIGMMGQNGMSDPKRAMKVIQEAQKSMEAVPEFKGNVKAVRTDVLEDAVAAKLYPDWKDHFEEWEKVGSDHRYHYLGSAIWFNRMGKAFGEAMLELTND